MKIAFVGKGGSGKTTLASLFARHLASTGAPVLAIDADINQHLGVALGRTETEAADLPTLGDHQTEIKEYLRGDNPRIRSAEAMIKTTPPGRGSRLVDVTGTNPLYERLAHDVNGVRLMVTGRFDEADLGVACYHSKVGAAELLLNHMVDGPGEYVIVDMTAGADSFASGLFTRFDQTFCVCEPTGKSVSVYRQYVGYARRFDIPVRVVGNKVEDAADVAFLTEAAGNDLAVCVRRSGYVRASERGESPSGGLEPVNRAALDRVREITDTTRRDWAAHTRHAVEFHLRNARGWANDRLGTDLADQIDPDFDLGAVSSIP